MTLNQVAVGDEWQDDSGDVYEITGIYPSRGFLSLADSEGIERIMSIEAMLTAIDDGVYQLSEHPDEDTEED